MEWLTSGLRRDVCVLLYGEQRRAQTLKSAIEARYDRRGKPDPFYGAPDALESNGVVNTPAAGLEGVHSLTHAGPRSVRTHAEWLCERVDPGSEAPGEDGDT